MALKPETINAFKEKAAAARGAEEYAKKAREQARLLDKPRVDALRKEMKWINSQIKANGQSQEGLRLFIEENPRRSEYETKDKAFTGLPIAQTYSQAVVLTSEGIKAFEIHHQIFPLDNDRIPEYSAKPMKLEHADIGDLLPQAKFTTADVLSLKITELIGN